MIVHATPEYSSENSQEGRYVFMYHIVIYNHGNTAAQLMRRHWFIVDGNEQVDEVIGDGVLGEQPVIAPGSTYEYSSFCILETPVGCMYGQYFMVAEDGTEFIADIPVFTLADKTVLQ